VVSSFFGGRGLVVRGPSAAVRGAGGWELGGEAVGWLAESRTFFRVPFFEVLHEIWGCFG